MLAEKESPIVEALNQLLAQWPVYSVALTDVYSFARLLLICADKIVVVYLVLVRDHFRAEWTIRLGEDVKQIKAAFAEITRTCSCDKYLCLIELRLRRLDDLV
jgi:hypothetical protein